MREMPVMLSSALSSNTVDANAMFQAIAAKQLAGPGIAQMFPPSVPLPVVQPRKEPEMATPQRRLIQVFIADPNENIPIDQCLLYSGAQQLTDLTDQELFFEIDVKTLLEKHNEIRTKVVDKAVKERVEYLEPAKVRDLKMTVVTIAQF